MEATAKVIGSEREHLRSGLDAVSNGGCTAYAAKWRGIVRGRIQVKNEAAAWALTVGWTLP